MQPYTIKLVEDPAFWQALNDFPKKGQDYPAVLTLGSYASFAVAPMSILQCYNDFKDPSKAMCFTVPATPSPITKVVYLIGPQVGMLRKVFAAFFYAEGQAVLAECSVFPLLHKPLALRIANGKNIAENRSFEVSNVVLKGDEAPVHMVLNSPNNPELGVTFTENVVEDVARLDIILRAPGLATMGINCGLAIL